MRILIVKLSSLGDLFHALPAVHNVKVGLQADIDWVVNDTYADLVQCFTDVDRVIPFHRNDIWGSLRGFRRELRRREYDMVVDMQGLLKSALVARMARSRRRIGPSFHREGARLFYTEVYGRRNKDRHAVEENLDLVRHLGMEPGKPAFPMALPDCPPELAGELEGPGPQVALLPLSRWETKNWPTHCFAEVARRLRDERGASIWVLGGPGDAVPCGELKEAIGDGAVNCAGRLSLPQTAALLRRMDLLVSNDSGPVHMAAAVGTPALVVFGPTEPARTGPFGEGHRVASAVLDCRPCLSRVCHKESVPCLSGVTPEYVLEMARDMLR